MKFRPNLTAAALILALHIGLLMLMGRLAPPVAKQAATPPAAALPSTVMVMLAPLPPKAQPKPPPQQHAAKEKFAATKTAAPSTSAPSARAALTVSLPDTGAATAVTLPTAPAVVAAVAEGKPTLLVPLKIGTQSMQSAAREADRSSVRRLALQSGKIDELETATPHPIALMAAEASVPRCPPKGQLREAVGPQGYALTRDRSGDCEYERKAKVRALALAR